MQIIKKTPNPSGSYPPMQSWDTIVPEGMKLSGDMYIPEGYYLVPDDVETADFYHYNGFVLLAVNDRTVIDMTPNTVAWENWKAEQPKAEENTVTESEQLRADLDYISIMTGVELV